MAQNGAFEAFFLSADADRDGRISGVEAINFFRAADLPQPTLAKIWEYANQSQTGFLSRQEFYNALKLATVAQTGRELTPELVKAALAGPAAAQIPPPRISLRESTPPPSSFEGTGATPQPSQSTPSTLQANYGQQFSRQSPDVGTLQRGSALRRLSSYEGSVAKRHHIQAESPCVSYVPSDSVQLQRSVDSLPSVDSCPKQLSTGNALQNASLDSASNAPHINFAVGGNPLVGDTAANCSPLPNSASSLGLSQPPSYLAATSNPGICGYDGRQLGAAPPLPAPNSPWPKMTPSDAQRFVHVFSQLDTDHHGKVTGEHARQLFLSWQLPREVLRHVWNLSDEDKDGMLSVREFCTAVYLLEKFTEGWPLPARLPTGIHLHEPPTPVRKLFAPEFLGSGESSWRPPQGSMPPTDFVFKPGLSPAHYCYAVSTTSERPLQDPLSPGKVPLERARCVPQANSPFINQNKESEEALTPTLTESDKLVPTQGAGFTKHIMSQKEKAEYCRSKLQEIVLFNSQCSNKMAEMTEKVITCKHLVNTLNQQCQEKSKSASDAEAEIAVQVSTLKQIQEKKRELSRALLRLESESRVSNSHLQAQFDQIAVHLQKLREILLVRAKSLGVEIKRQLPKTMAFGWQANIQEKAAEWEKGWDSFNDEGFTEVQEIRISPTPEASLLANFTGDESGAASAKVDQGESALAIDILDCRFHREPSQQHTSVLESSAPRSSVSVTITSTGASAETLVDMPDYNDKSRSTNETSTDNAVHVNLCVVSGSSSTEIVADTLTRDAAITHPAIVVESAIEIVTTAGENISAISAPSLIAHPGAESSNSEVGSSTTSESAFGRNETLGKMGQNDDIAEPSSLPSARELQKSRSSRNTIQIKQSRGQSRAKTKARSGRGSFEPEDYFDLSPRRDHLNMLPLLSSGTLTGSPAVHDSLETFGFLVYTVKESRQPSPVLTRSVDATSVVTEIHGPDEHPNEESTVFDESGGDAPSPSVSGK